MDGFLSETLDLTVTYHDPCDLGRGARVFDAPREVIRSIPGVRLVELPRNRENCQCCGGVETRDDGSQAFLGDCQKENRRSAGNRRQGHCHVVPAVCQNHDGPTPKEQGADRRDGHHAAGAEGAEAIRPGPGKMTLKKARGCLFPSFRRRPESRKCKKFWTPLSPG